MEKEIVLSGIVTSGTGEGKYFMAMPEYMKRFAAALGGTFYPGTLNIKLEAISQKRFESLKSMKGKRIEGFESNGKKFGGVTVFPAKIRDENCAIVVPDKGRYNDVVEVISDLHLRETMRLKDGERVSLTVML